MGAWASAGGPPKGELDEGTEEQVFIDEDDVEEAALDTPDEDAEHPLPPPQLLLLFKELRSS